MNGFSEKPVKEFLEEIGCKLIGTNLCIRSDTQFEFECECGARGMTQLSSLREGSRCEDCNKKKWTSTLKDRRKYYRKWGCVLLSEIKKINPKSTLLKFRCFCKEEDRLTLNNFICRHRCRSCMAAGIRYYPKVIESPKAVEGHKKQPTRWNLDMVREVFDSFGCVCLATVYENMNTRMDFQCSCGNQGRITLESFLNEVRCPDCNREKRQRTREEMRNCFNNSRGIEGEAPVSNHQEISIRSKVFD